MGVPTIRGSEAALSALERGKTAMDRVDRGPESVPPSYKAQLLIRLRSIRADLQESPTEHGPIGPSYLDAIQAARQTNDPDAEASAWNLLGQENIAAGNLEEAEAALGQALRLRTSHSPEYLSFSYAALGELRLAQADRASGEERRRRAKEAEVFTERAIDSGPSRPALSVLFHQRGQTREALGQPELALQDFRMAVSQASEWNGAVPAALSLLTGANVAMQHEIFDSFVEAAARQALRTGDQGLAEDSFLALEANRAVSLRESRELAPLWKKWLPAAYWETLGRLNAQESRDLSGGGMVSPEAKRLHLELTEMESLAGAGVSVMWPENFRTRNSLIHFQQGLGESDLILSFYLGKRESYLWAVTDKRVKLRRLPPESEIREDVRRFREAILGDRPERDRLGAKLYQRLFGSLEPADAAKASWLVSLDGVLFDLPFAALVSGYENGQPVYAAELHSTQTIPGALFLNRQAAAQGDYLGVADAVYNSADPREPGGWSLWKGLPQGRDQLNRLVSSRGELERSSASWRTATGVARAIQMLEGPAARSDAFLQALTAAPSTIHLATHVLTSTTRSEQAFLAFSLNASGSPGLLSTSEIGMLRVPGALVVMTGCATGTGDVRVGAGLLGLTRAWMMAGARAVVATNWPVPDIDGDLIPDFYRHLQLPSGDAEQ